MLRRESYVIMYVISMSGEAYIVSRFSLESGYFVVITNVAKHLQDPRLNQLSVIYAGWTF